MIFINCLRQYNEIHVITKPTAICKILATSFTIHDDVLLHHKHNCPMIYLNVMVTIEIPVCCFPFECQESCKPLYLSSMCQCSVRGAYWWYSTVCVVYISLAS